MTRLLLLLAALLALALPARAALTPAELAEAELNPPAGAALPLDLPLRDEAGRAVTPAAVLVGRPAVLLLADFTCETLCGTAIGLAANALAGTGADAVLLVIGLDPRDGPAEAAAMKSAYLAPYPEVAARASFLTGAAPVLARAQAALGYHARFDAEADRYAHPLAAVVLTPAGDVSRTISGIALDAETLGPALREAAEGRTGLGLLQGLRLFCYGLDPAHGIYNAIVRRGLAVGTGAVIVLMAIGVLLMRRRRRA
ncbi:MAG: hypothetical protein JWR10_1615 [Rubritepida sp.]|nr:hypothetical protein [Rubritepida sp.]